MRYFWRSEDIKAGVKINHPEMPNGDWYLVKMSDDNDFILIGDFHMREPRLSRTGMADRLNEQGYQPVKPTRDMMTIWEESDIKAGVKISAAYVLVTLLDDSYAILRTPTHSLLTIGMHKSQMVNHLNTQEYKYDSSR